MKNKTEVPNCVRMVSHMTKQLLLAHILGTEGGKVS